MSEIRNYYVICDDNCRFPSMTKEEILTAITQAVEQGEIHDIDTGFITKIKEQNAGRELKFWVGTQAQYNALAEPEENVMYLITDPQADAELQAQIDALQAELDGMKAVDITDEITLAVALGDVTITDKKYVYEPANGIVRFWIGLTDNAENPEELRAITLSHSGSYQPAATATLMPVNAEAFAMSAPTDGIVDKAFYLTFGTPPANIYLITHGFADMVLALSGWYYCEGA